MAAGFTAQPLPALSYPHPTGTCGAWATEDEIKHPFDESLAAE